MNTMNILDYMQEHLLYLDGGMGSTLLVGGQNVPQLALIVIQFVINIEDGAAGIAEDGIDSLLQQALQNCGSRFDFQK